MSGSFPTARGVGTQMKITSASESFAGSDVKRASISASSSSAISSMCERPAFNESITLSFTSKPVTGTPARACVTTKGKPT